MCDKYTMGLESDEVTTRNSSIRGAVGPFMDDAMGKFHEAFPGVTANHISFAGLCGTVAAAYAASRIDDKTSTREKVGVALSIGAAAALDAFDGSLARASGTSSFFGQRIDAAIDRVGDTALAMSRAKQAQERGGISGLIGEGLAYGAAVTSHKPARERANQEAKGNVVPESPGSLLLLPGTAVGRRAVAAVSTAFPKVQIIGDAWTIASNLVVARRRQKATIANNVLPDAKREEGRARYSDMTKLQGAATVASAALAIGSRLSGKFSSEKSRNAIKNNDKG
jgi:tellurite resistance protein